jgi:signal transduction histidine kinase
MPAGGLFGESFVDSLINILVIENGYREFPMGLSLHEDGIKGCAFLRSETLHEGLPVLQRENIDCILLCLIPENGLAHDSSAIEALIGQTVKTAKNVPLVVLSTFYDDTLASKALRMGAQDYLAMGEFDNATLYRTIRHAIQRQCLLTKLHEYEEMRFRKIIEKNADGIIIVDNEGVVLFANPSAEELFEKKSTQLLGITLGFPLCSGENTEIEILRKNMTICFVEMRVVEIEWEGQKAYLASMRDVTEQKHMIEEIRNLTKNLEKRVSDEIAKQRKQEQMLIQKSKMASMGEMISSIAHQWRQPLNAIGLLVQDFHEAYLFGELTEAYILENVNKSMEQIDYMSNTIEDFRNFFRISKEMTPFDVISALRRVINIVQVQLKIRYIVVRFLYDKKHIYMVNGFRNEFMQAVLNVINNAKDAIITSQEKGLLANDKGEITINVRKESDRILIEIQDNGGGIDERIKERIFEPDFTSKSENMGTGIGLYMSKLIIEDNMSGKLTAENTDKGAKFLFTLNECLSLM